MIAIGRLPRPILQLFGIVSGFFLRIVPNSSERVTRANLSLAYPELPSDQQNALVRASLNDLAHKFFRLLATWQKPPAQVVNWVVDVDGFEAFDAACATSPTLILLPHLGNWELFGLWLSTRRPYTAMFRPMRVEQMSHLVRAARERGGNQLVAASPVGVKHILHDLKCGKTAILLPDQTPKQGVGEFVPFFSIDTLTATLPYRIAHATQARVFVAGAVAVQGGYKVFFDELKQPTYGVSRQQWLGLMNQTIEKWVRQFPEQYQWEYNRFHAAPEGGIRKI